MITKYFILLMLVSGPLGEYEGEILYGGEPFIKSIRSGKTPPLGMIPFPISKPNIPKPQKHNNKTLEAK
jgi:hypothetical protein